MKLNFSLVNLSYVNMIIRSAKEPRKEEGKSFPPLLGKIILYSSSTLPPLPIAFTYITSLTVILVFMEGGRSTQRLWTRDHGK